jgi:hypothetical protein
VWNEVVKPARGWRHQRSAGQADRPLGRDVHGIGLEPVEDPATRRQGQAASRISG